MIQTPYHLAGCLREHGHDAHVQDYGGWIKHATIQDGPDSRLIVCISECEAGEEQLFEIWIESDGVPDVQMMLGPSTFGAVHLELCELLG